MLDESNELTTWIFALHRALVEDGYDADALMKRAGFDFSTISSTSEYRSPELSYQLIFSSLRFRVIHRCRFSGI
jgi:hypothetical protein